VNAVVKLISKCQKMFVMNDRSSSCTVYLYDAWTTISISVFLD